MRISASRRSLAAGRHRAVDHARRLHNGTRPSRASRRPPQPRQRPRRRPHRPSCAGGRPPQPRASGCPPQEAHRSMPRWLGPGLTTAVFVHEAGSRGLCGFWPYADWLARTKGVRSVLFSQCGAGASQCPAGNAADQWLAVTTAAVTWARAHGAGQVTLVGASAGGVVALQVAASISPPVAAVVNLSGARRGRGWTRWRPPGACRCRRCSPSLRGTALSAWARCSGCIRPLRSGPSGWWCWPRARAMVRSCWGAWSAWSPLAVTVAAWIQGRHG